MLKNTIIIVIKMSSPEDFQVQYSPQDLQYYLYTHDLYTAPEAQCTVKENRFKTSYTNAEGKPQELYCWKGRIRVHPDCTIGSVCDPFSYTNARSSFCRTWGCKPDLYVSNSGTIDQGLPVVNQRGGIVVYNEAGKCTGAIVSQFNCILGGFRQSIANVVDPKNRKKFLVGIVLFTALLMFGAIGYKMYKQKYGKRKRVKVFG